MNWVVPANVLLLWTVRRLAQIIVLVVLAVDIKVSIFGPYESSHLTALLALMALAMFACADQLAHIGDPHCG